MNSQGSLPRTGCNLAWEPSDHYWGDLTVKGGNVNKNEEHQPDLTDSKEGLTIYKQTPIKKVLCSECLKNVLFHTTFIIKYKYMHHDAITSNNG